MDLCLHFLLLLLLPLLLFLLLPLPPPRYDKKLKEARHVGTKKGISVGVALGSIFFILFLVYAVAFW